MSKATKAKRRQQKTEETISFRGIFRRPVWDKFQLSYMRDVATRYAAAHAADPHAYNRIYLHMYNGIALVSDVLDEATRLLEAAAARRQELLS
jgi:hypothetical protein